MNCITRRPAGPIALLAVSLMTGLAMPAFAADKEQQQMMADIRMLQEQTQLLANMLRSLTDALKAVSAKIDEQAGADRKSFADSKLTIDALTGEMRVVREKLDDSGVRLSTLTQEVDAVRQSIQQVPLSRLPATGAPDAAAARAAGAATAPAVPAGTSPNRLWEGAMADYSASQWNLAIQGFESYLRTFPTYDKADDAQVYIGHSFFGDGKFEQAIEAYDKAIRAYPTSDAIPDAYYRKGVALNTLMQTDEARQTWDALIATFPTSDAAVLAKQRIDQLKRP